MSEQIEAKCRSQALAGADVSLPSRFSTTESVDSWRHTRMLDCAPVLRQSRPSACAGAGGGPRERRAHERGHG